MIDELYKEKMDLFWDHFGKWVARSGLTPNAVTVIGFVLCVTNAAAFLWHRNYLAYGLFVAGIELLDNVDGAVARVTGQSSKLGSYLDAATDRYKDFFILLAIAEVTGLWLACTLAIAGSLITSYNHARAAMLGAGDDGPYAPKKSSFPDLFERFERIGLLCIGLAVSHFVPTIGDRPVMFYVVWVVAIGTHVTGVQRFFRRARQLRDMERAA